MNPSNSSYSKVEITTLLTEKASKKQQEIEATKFKQQADENIRASQQAEQFKQQTAQLEAQFEIQKQDAIAKAEIAKEKARGEQDRLTLAQKIEGDIQVQLLMNSGATQKLEKMQSDKEKNQAQAATATSRIADQKAKEKDPIDFEGEKSEMEMFNV